MHQNVIALPGNAPGLSEYRRGAELAAAVLEEIRRQSLAGRVPHHELGEALGGLSPDARHGFLVVVAVVIAAAATTAPADAMCRQIEAWLAALDDDGSAA